MSKDSSEKILLLGLAESGKTTIIRVITEGYTPEKKAKYAATLNYERKNINVLGKTLTIFDLGGQVAFLDRFTGELAEFIFGGVKSLIFVVDTVNVAELSRSKYYFDLAVKQLNKFSPATPINVLLHKMDLLGEDKIEEIAMNMISYMKTGIKQPINYYNTTVFTDSIFKAIGDIFGVVAGGEGTELSSGSIVESFAKKHSKLITRIQLFDKNGKPLVATSDFYDVSLEQTKKMMNTSLFHISSNETRTSSVLLDSDSKYYYVNFIKDGSVLIINFSLKDLKANNETVASFYDKINSLAIRL